MRGVSSQLGLLDLLGYVALALAPALVVAFDGGCLVNFGQDGTRSDSGTGYDAQSTCGNGLHETGEDCDGPDLGGRDCESLGFHSGTLFCDEDCTFDVTSCREEGCGNGLLDPGEPCDGSELGGNTCTSQGYSGGILACTYGCALDVSSCFWCGNGVVDPGELCDGSNLAQTTCTDLGLSGTGLVCEDCQFDIYSCEWCGNGRLDPGEGCEGTDLRQQSCTSLDFSAGGDLACAEDCTLDLAACVPCTSSNCLVGCCRAGRECMAGTSLTNCGASGAVCEICPIAEQCCISGQGGNCGVCM